jgi:hypothetical protein
MSFFPSLTILLFPFKQVHHLGQAQSLLRFFSVIENGHACYELLSKNKHLVSTDYSLFCFVIALLNPYSHNSHPFLLHDFGFVQFPPSSCFISLLPFLFLHHDCCSLLLAFYSLLFHDCLLVSSRVQYQSKYNYKYNQNIMLNSIP